MNESKSVGTEAVEPGSVTVWQRRLIEIDKELRVLSKRERELRAEHHRLLERLANTTQRDLFEDS